MSKSTDQDSLQTMEDAVFAQLAMDMRPIAPPEDRALKLRARVMEEITHEKKTASTDFITLRADEGWFELAPKIEKKILHINHEAGTESYLLRVQAGAEVPPHTHAADELCIVLEGEVIFGGKLRLQAGDYHMAKRGSTHQYARSETGALVYLQGAMEDRENVFRD